MPQNSNLVIVKKHREDPITDKPVKFPPLENLHLELLENKRKLKPNLPLIPVQKKLPPKVENKKVEEPPNDKKEAPTKKIEKKVEKKEEEEEEEIEIEFEDNEEEEEEDDKELIEELVEDEEEEIKEEEDEEEEDPNAGLTPEEIEEKEKKEYVWKFDLLRKKYKDSETEIPVYNEHSDLVVMKNKYDTLVKELTIDDSVESYRTYLMFGFVAIEYLCTQWLSVDLSGFTVQQVGMMGKYNKLLVELGEKSRESWTMNLPVEVRIIGMILVQAGIFYLGKIISNKFGNHISDIFRGMTGNPVPVQEEPNKKKKMRGPKIRPEDIRNGRKED